MDLQLRDKVAWVLGASSGLGRASAESLGREGALVAVSARRAGPLDEVVETVGSGAVAVPLDVTDSAAIETAAREVASRLGAIDILVVNAGGPPPGGFEATGADGLARGFDLTLASAWHLAKQVVPAMKTLGRGCVIFITSSSTKEVIPSLLLSNMMRAAVVGMAKTMSKELGPHGIRVLCVAPGRIETPRVVSLDENAAETSGRGVAEIRSESEARIPLGRYGRPHEFGDVLAFLASERASYVSGVTVTVDGGALNGILS